MADYILHRTIAIKALSLSPGAAATSKQQAEPASIAPTLQCAHIPPRKSGTIVEVTAITCSCVLHNEPEAGGGEGRRRRRGGVEMYDEESTSIRRNRNSFWQLAQVMMCERREQREA